MILLHHLLVPISNGCGLKKCLLFALNWRLQKRAAQMNGGYNYGFLSKLLGEDAEKAAKELLGGLADAAKGIAEAAEGISGAAGNKTADVERSGSRGDDAAKIPAVNADEGQIVDAPWGDVMPDEENQYNYKGSYTEYFEHIFSMDFAEYRTEKSFVDGSRRVVYTFYKGGSRRLVVELMPESSVAKKLRSECEREGVPYRRFYFNHHGWWNTRSYVTGRIREALGK